MKKHDLAIIIQNSTVTSQTEMLVVYHKIQPTVIKQSSVVNYLV